MDVKTAITARRAVKRFDTQHQMTRKEIDELLSLAMHSPTAFNIQNWRFVVADDPELRQRIRSVSGDQPQVTDSSLLIILCADLQSWAKEPTRYWRHAPTGVQDFVVPAIDNYYRHRHQVQRDEAMRSCGIAAQTLMLAAKSMGYDSCPMDGFDFDAVARLIGLPNDHVVAMFVAIGKAEGEPWPRPGQLPMKEVVITNHF
jgi:nitroreductase